MAEKKSELVVGVISDTHGLLRPEASAALRGSDLIVHAGDVGAWEILEELADIAPVFAIQGNVDTDTWALEMPETRIITAGETRLYVIHDLNRMKQPPGGVAAVIYGHSHKPSIEMRGAVLYLNPGSAGPRRFKLPVTLARIRVRGTHLEPELIQLL